MLSVTKASISCLPLIAFEKLVVSHHLEALLSSGEGIASCELNTDQDGI